MSEISRADLSQRFLSYRRSFLRALNLMIASRPWSPYVRGRLDGDIVALMERERAFTDIADHLVAIYAEALEVHPGLIVELGTRGGESTAVFLRVADRCGSVVVSVDIAERPGHIGSDRWYFVRRDDVAFASEFPEWIRERGREPAIDVLFVDTSHKYEHTRDEIRSWIPYLSACGKVLFHDTNLRRWYRRRNWTVGHGWPNRRGVIRAIEEFLGVQIDERQAFTAVVGDWVVRHTPTCNGLTVLERLPSRSCPAGPRSVTARPE